MHGLHHLDALIVRDFRRRQKIFDIGVRGTAFRDQTDNQGALGEFAHFFGIEQGKGGLGLFEVSEHGRLPNHRSLTVAAQ